MPRSLHSFIWGEGLRYADQKGEPQANHRQLRLDAAPSHFGKKFIKIIDTPNRFMRFRFVCLCEIYA